MAPTCKNLDRRDLLLGKFCFVLVLVLFCHILINIYFLVFPIPSILIVIFFCTIMFDYHHLDFFSSASINLYCHCVKFN